MKSKSVFLILGLVLALPVFVEAATYLDGQSGQKVSKEEVLKNVRKGQVVVLSEWHGFEPHHQNQRDFLVDISGASFPINVGMEFLDYPKQEIIDQYGNSKLDEAAFLQQVGWGGNNFSNYRFQVRLPYFRSGRTLGLNMPRSVTSQVAKHGLASLTEEQKKLMPPQFKLGQASLYERFRAVMKGHVPEASLANYFAAHSIWDDTMAWRAAEHMKAQPNGILIVIVGDFHLAYMDGLVARMQARGIKDILAISQISTYGMTEDERRELVMPHAVYGPRAHFVFDAEEKFN